VRLDPDRIGVVGDGASLVARVGVGLAAAPDGIDAVGIEPERLGEIGNRVLVVELGIIGQPRRV
jgi:hypothetical protein